MNFGIFSKIFKEIAESMSYEMEKPCEDLATRYEHETWGALAAHNKTNDLIAWGSIQNNEGAVEVMKYRGNKVLLIRKFGTTEESVRRYVAEALREANAL